AGHAGRRGHRRRQIASHGSGRSARRIPQPRQRARPPARQALLREVFRGRRADAACSSRGNEERMYLIEDWAQFILDLPIRGRMHLGEKSEPPPYGRYFSYCTGGVFTLSEILQKTTGVRTDHYAQDKLFGPLGIADAQWVYSPMNI